jgi:hypothetical protein
MIFHPTQPATESGPLRVSEFQRRRGMSDGDAETSAGLTQLSSLSPSLLQDLLRFEEPDRDTDGLDVLLVMAAALRHGRNLRLHLEYHLQVLPLTVFPVNRLVHLPLSPLERDKLRLNRLRLLHVEPAPADALRKDTAHLWPLGLLLWELALRGTRDELLPQIAGHAAYRIAPGANLDGLELSGSLAMAVERMRRDARSLRSIAEWPGFDRERAIRLVNGLYLQSALMVSRAHPAATNDGWASSR